MEQFFQNFSKINQEKDTSETWRAESDNLFWIQCAMVESYICEENIFEPFAHGKMLRAKNLKIDVEI